MEETLLFVTGKQIDTQFNVSGKGMEDLILRSHGLSGRKKTKKQNISKAILLRCNIREIYLSGERCFPKRRVRRAGEAFKSAACK